MNRNEIALQLFIKRVQGGYITSGQEKNVSATAIECFLLADLFLEAMEKANAQEAIPVSFSDESDV